MSFYPVQNSLCKAPSTSQQPLLQSFIEIILCHKQFISLTFSVKSYKKILYRIYRMLFGFTSTLRWNILYISCSRKSDLAWYLILPCMFYKNSTVPGYVSESIILDKDVSENISGGCLLLLIILKAHWLYCLLIH